MRVTFAAVQRVAAFSITAVAAVMCSQSSLANSSAFSLAGGNFQQDWSNAALITVNDNWDGVPAIIGYQTAGAVSSATGTDPQTLLGESTTVDVNASNACANTFNTGGVTECALANPTIMLTGSGTASSPNIVLFLDTTGRQDISVAYNLRDIESSADNATQQFALQYRVGASGSFINIPAGYVADATEMNTATRITPVSAALPAAANDQPLVQIRILTSNAVGNDENVGVDDIVVSSSPVVAPTPTFTIGNATPNPVVEGAATDSTVVNFEVRLSQASDGASVNFATADGSAVAGSDYTAVTQTLTFTGAQVSRMVPVTILGDNLAEAMESFTATLSGNSAGTAIDSSMASGTANIMDDDGTPSLSIADASVLEGNVGAGNLAFTVSLSPANTTDTVTVTATTSDATALAGTDYTATSATLSFAPNVTTQTFTVPVTGDVEIEADETLTVTLSAASNAQIALATATGTLTNDDASNPMACGMPATRISAAQGSSASTPLNNTQVQVEGVVVGDFQGANGLNGFYLQEETADQDADDATSEGLFVLDPSTPVAVAAGQIVRVAGTVNEGFQQTQISSVSSVMVCNATPVAVTPVTVNLPFAALTTPEQYEGMLVRFPQTLSVTNNFTLARFGEFELSSNGRLVQPTQIVLPGTPANELLLANNLNRILVDDANGTQNRDPIVYPGTGLTADNTLRGGDTVTGITGVLGFGFSFYRLQPTVAPVFAGANPRTAAPSLPGTGSLRVASFNVLNYFNGNGTGGGFPTSRGAETAAEFSRQRAKIISALGIIRPDVVGLIEIENDGYGSTSAIADLVNGLNAAAPSGTSYAFVNPGRAAIGTDEIAVGFVYRVETVQPSGASAILDTSVDARFLDTRNRPALAQTFTEIASGAKFTAVINHFKSKGSACSESPDLMDGQGNCNGTRNQAALALKDWLATDPTASGDPDFLILGDLNAYAKEDPIRTLETAGFVNLVEASNPPGSTTLAYQFDGLWGTLDYGLANASLRQQVTGATEWLINGAEPIALDYNTNFKSANQQNTLYNSGPYRSSDHDPVVIELALTAAPCAAGSLSFKNAPYAVTETNGSLTLNVMVERTGGSCGAVAVTVASSSGSTANAATAGSDYTAVSSTLNWADGDAADKTLAVTILGDTVEEATELFGLGLAGATNDATAGAATTVTISDDDAAAPLVTATAPVTSPTNAATASFNVSFSRAVTGVDVTDFSLIATGLTGASITGISGSGASYTVAVSTGTGSGSLRLDLVDDDSIVSAESKPLGGSGAGNGNFAGQTLAVDRSGPTVTLEQSVAQADPATASPIRFTVLFSEVVSDFDASDVIISGTAFASGTTPAVAISGGGSSYELAVSGMSGNGTVVASVRATAVSDAAGNASTASSSADNTVSFSGGALPTVQWSLATQSVSESVGTLTATVTLSAANATQTVTVDYASVNGTAVAGPGGDYSASSSTLSFAPGETSKTVMVSLTDDALFEGEEGFSLTLGNPVNASLGAATQAVTIGDNETQPTVSLSLAPASFGENTGAATVTATLSGATTQTVTVSLGASGTATLGSDYNAASSIIIAAGELSGSTTLSALQDAVFEGDESATLSITAVQGAGPGTPASVTATLVDDEAQPNVRLSLSGSPLAETGGSATLTATLSGLSTQPVTVTLGYGGTATAADYTAAGMLTIAAGASSASAAITATGDTLVEGNESIVVSINSASNAAVGSPMSVTATITDDDVAPPQGPTPSVTLSLGSSTLAETGGSTTVTATLSAASTQPVTVTLGYTGTAGSSDFSGPATLVVAAGATSASAALTPVGDSLDEGEETLVVSIRSLSAGATLGSPSSASVTIRDDDIAARVSLAAAELSSGEGAGSVNVQLQLSTASGREVSVPLIFGGTATRVDDYVPSASRIVFAPGETTASFNITLNADGVREANETVTITLGTPVNAEPGTLSSSTLTILDNGEVPLSGPVQQRSIADAGARAVSVAINNGTLARAALVAAPAQAPAASSTTRYDNGFFAFDIEGLAPGATVTLTLTLPADARPTSYLKCVRGSCATYGRAAINANVVTLTLVDGGDGDDDGLANGVIRDPGAPVTLVSSPVDNGGGGSLGGGLLVGLAALAALRRRKLTS